MGDIAPGYIFKPEDNELLTHLKKMNDDDQPFPHCNCIHVLNFLQSDPHDLAKRFKAAVGMEHWYFFTPKGNAYDFSQPNRVARNGYWRATCSEESIQHNGIEIGSKKSFVYYSTIHPRPRMTTWMVTEFKLKDGQTAQNNWLICKLYKNT